MKAVCLIIAIIGVLGMNRTWAFSRPATMPATHAATNSATITINVDPRVELISIVFRLAGNPEYGQGAKSSYLNDVDKQFGPFKDHELVKLAHRLNAKRGVAFDAPMSLAVHLDGAVEIKERVPLTPWPSDLDRRWTAEDVQEFVALARDFVVKTNFEAFVRDHQALYDVTAKRMEALLAERGHLEWFARYYGAAPGIQFFLYPALVNGGCCYGPKFWNGQTRESYCILGVLQMDREGIPQFPPSALPVVIHEFNHSFCNPLVYANLEELRPAGEKLYASKADRMKRMAYGSWSTMMHESLVRASVVRYIAKYEGSEAAQAEIALQEKQGFEWTGALASLLEQYEADRTTYTTLADFMPRIIEFFNTLASDTATKPQ